MEKTPEFIYGRILRKYEDTRMKDVEKYPSLSKIGEFSKFEGTITDAVEAAIELGQDELPILLCRISSDTWALITTRRLVSFMDGVASEIGADDCDGCWPIDAMNPPVKKEGAISPHIAEAKNGENMRIDLPSGSAAITFQGAVLVLSRLRL